MILADGEKGGKCRCQDLLEFQRMGIEATGINFWALIEKIEVDVCEIQR